MLDPGEDAASMPCTARRVVHVTVQQAVLDPGDRSRVLASSPLGEWLSPRAWQRCRPHAQHREETAQALRGRSDASEGHREGVVVPVRASMRHHAPKGPKSVFGAQGRVPDLWYGCGSREEIDDSETDELKSHARDGCSVRSGSFGIRKNKG